MLLVDNKKILQLIRHRGSKQIQNYTAIVAGCRRVFLNAMLNAMPRVLH